MKAIAAILIVFGSGCITLRAQVLTDPVFIPSRLSADSLKVEDQPRLGGISAIHYVKPGEMLIVSDHDKADKKSYQFTVDSNGRVLSVSKFYDLAYVESVRYNEKLKKWFYTYESDVETGVGYIESDKPKPIFATKMKSNITTDNRGIEGLTFDSDNNLWLAFESGANNCDSSVTPFYRIPVREGNYDTANKIVYNYAFHRCPCIENKQKAVFTGANGNGVTEILAFPGKSDKLLVLERCFDTEEREASVRLYVATIDSNSIDIKKSLLYDFSHTSHANFKPQNMEGMTWGRCTDDTYTLYIVSDSNFNLQNQFIVLFFTVKDSL